MPAKEGAGEKSVWFVAGNDEFAVKKRALELSVELAPSGDPMGVEVIDCDVATMEEAFDKIALSKNAVLTMPMFFSEKLVWMKNVSFLADSKLGGGKELIEESDRFIEMLAAGLPRGIRLLISAVSPDKRRGGYKRLSGISVHKDFTKQDFTWGGEEEVVRWIYEQARKRGFSISADALEALAVRVGGESRQLEIELDKLAVVAQEEGEIGVETIRDLVPPTRQSGIFDLSNAIVARNLREALKLLDQLFLQKETAMGLLLAAVVPTIRNLVVVKELCKKHRIKPVSINSSKTFTIAIGRLPDGATAHLPRKKDGGISAYSLSIAAKGCPNYTAQELEKAFSLCRKTNLTLVTSSLDSKMVLGKLMLEVLA